ncbi:MAG: IMP dehydrogenase [Deltaproteobacteria bacterium CG11_big_fil_rev_8_21_14_0_20_49_13]|nr:MAG: IMP dehydrogenase [Deltaproteobacteria bacterium CG11_big_fil_rev_8_21_14_0_20_49_13]
MFDIKEALTFDDVLLIPQETSVLPKDCDLSTRFTPRITLALPLVSAAMDTVTESATAIAMAVEGGIGIIHRNLSVEDQAREVRKVKRFESGIVFEPITIEAEKTVRQAVELKELHKVSGFPVVRGGKLVGILTNRDIVAARDHSKSVSSAMTPIEELITLREGESVDKARDLLFSNRIEKLPIVNASGELRGLITVKDVEKQTTSPNATRDEHGRLRVGAAIGAGPKEIERSAALIEAGVDCVVIDTAHAFSKGVLETIKIFKKEFKDKELVAGNIATAEAAEALIKHGADAVKVGMGPGSICTTRVVSGVGMPQVTAIANCAEVARKKGIPVIGDGGIKFSGDLTKAVAAGADSIMIGSLFAGTDESPGEMFMYQGRPYKGYRGMGSLGAMNRGSKERYCQGHITETDKFVPEGIEGRVPHKGRLSQVLHQLIGGLRSGMGYVGCANITELQTKAKFVKISPAGLREGHVHDVAITKEAPNYRGE